jgi:aminoglycoside phosphotransferase (APT) family kinase protein
MDTPAAEIDVTEDLVDRLVRGQHPDLAGPVRLVANGWDNALFRLGDHLSVRLPRRQLAVQLARHEQRWLPELAARVSVPVPVPVRVGEPGAGYPWPWSITPWYEGVLAAEVAPADRAPVAGALAEFLVRLHVPAPPDAPVNPVRGVPLAHRDEAVRSRLAALAARGELPAVVRAAELRDLWEAALAVPGWSGPAVWLHGDPHPANLLLTGDGTGGAGGSGRPGGTGGAGGAGAGGRAVGLAAVLDFGDLAGGDPATDLAAGWLVFEAAGRAAFREAADRAAGGGGIDRDTWARARGWALCMGSSMATSADDDPRIAAIGWHALEQVLLDG